MIQTNPRRQIDQRARGLAHSRAEVKVVVGKCHDKGIYEARIVASRQRRKSVQCWTRATRKRRDPKKQDTVASTNKYHLIKYAAFGTFIICLTLFGITAATRLPNDLKLIGLNLFYIFASSSNKNEKERWTKSIACQSRQVILS